jgi:hypothetical protein
MNDKKKRKSDQISKKGTKSDHLQKKGIKSEKRDLLGLLQLYEHSFHFSYEQSVTARHKPTNQKLS